MLNNDIDFLWLIDVNVDCLCICVYFRKTRVCNAIFTFKGLYRSYRGVRVAFVSGSVEAKVSTTPDLTRVSTPVTATCANFEFTFHSFSIKKVAFPFKLCHVISVLHYHFFIMSEYTSSTGVSLKKLILISVTASKLNYWRKWLKNCI